MRRSDRPGTVLFVFGLSMLVLFPVLPSETNRKAIGAANAQTAGPLDLAPRRIVMPHKAAVRAKPAEPEPVVIDSSQTKPPERRKKRVRAVEEIRVAQNIDVPAQLPKQERRTLTKEIQRRLNLLGYSVGVADGVTGPHTRAAILKFQSDEKLEPDGEITQGLLESLKNSPSQPEEKTATLQPKKTAPVTAPDADPDPVARACVVKDRKNLISKKPPLKYVQIEQSLDRVIKRFAREGYPEIANRLLETKADFEPRWNKNRLHDDFFGVDRLPPHWEIIGGKTELHWRRGLGLQAAESLTSRWANALTDLFGISVNAKERRDEENLTIVQSKLTIGPEFRVRIRFIPDSGTGRLRVALLGGKDGDTGYAVDYLPSSEISEPSLRLVYKDGSAERSLSSFKQVMGVDEERLQSLQIIRFSDCRIFVTVTGISLIQARHQAAQQFDKIRITATDGDFYISQVAIR